MKGREGILEDERMTSDEEGQFEEIRKRRETLINLDWVCMNGWMVMRLPSMHHA